MRMDCSKDSKGILHCVFHYSDSAYTLRPEDVGKHENGWELKAIIHEDYYEWVNYFEAFHPIHGKVWGDFESEVQADSYTAIGNFLDNFEPHEWDYADI